jgi:hypothetical protein
LTDKPWVAWVEGPHPEKPKERLTMYLWRGVGTWTVDVNDAARFHTRKEALAAVDDSGPRRIGTRKGATKMEGGG